MTLPKGWKNEQKSSSSTITMDDKIVIQELIAKYNLDIDNKNIDEWITTWIDDGIWTTTFGEAKGKIELKNMVNQITNEFASGKRHVSTNIVIENASPSSNSMASAKSYLTVIEAHKTPEVVATGVYSDTLKIVMENGNSFNVN